ncbi:MAG: beta-lactamase family protein [Ignavibacteria bacterium]|nr:beta-lactamase family protein [Ignavibacteria bacterium]
MNKIFQFALIIFILTFPCAITPNHFDNTISVSLTQKISFPDSSNTDQNSFVIDNGILNDLHKNNTGRITFMAENIPIEEFEESDFLTSFELKQKCDLNIRVFLKTSLTNSLHILAPELTAEELTAKGNYQFNFFVDDSLIYKENLNPGAGSKESKNISTILRIPLISTTGEDSWGRFLWQRFMFKGGEDALQEGTHNLEIEIRPYVKTGEVKTGELIASGELTINIVRPDIPPELIEIQSIKQNSGWEVSTEEYDRDLIRQLKTKIAENYFKEITSIVVIKNGRLLLEEYFNGSARDSLHDTRSVGKSFASAITGIAIEEGHIKSENQILKDYYDLKNYRNYTLKKDSVQIKNLLTMSSAFLGFDFDESSPGNEENMYPTGDWVKFTLDLPMDPSKTNGGKWEYFTAGVVVLGDILNKSVPGGLGNYSSEKLLKPLGINKFEWEYTPQGVVNTAGGWHMRPLDYAKFGQLYKNGGSWNGKQIIPKSWVKKSLSKQISIPNTENEFYGYLFWNTTFRVDNESYEAFYSSGNGGNKIFIFKDQPIVVVVTSNAFGKMYAHAQVNKIMEKYILPSVIR